MGKMTFPVSVAAHKPTASGRLPPGFGQLADELPRLVSGLEGYLGDREMRLLALFAALPTASGEVLEIGSFKGKSTIVLAKAAQLAGQKSIVAVDPLTSPAVTDPSLRGEASGWKDFEANLRRAGVFDQVEFYRECSSDLALKWNPQRKIRLLWIDGDHTYRGAKLDFDLFRPFLADGAVLAMHDVLHQNDGPVRVFAEDVLRSPDFGAAGFCGSIGWSQFLPEAGGSSRHASLKARLLARLNRLLRHTSPGASNAAWHRLLYRVARSGVPHAEVAPEAIIAQLQFG